MKIEAIKLLVVAAMILASSEESRGQETSSNHRRAWVSTGFWWPVIRANLGPAAAINLSYQRDVHLISGRALATVDGCFICDDNDEFWDVSVLYGRTTALKALHASIAGGVGVVGGDRVDLFDQPREFSTTVGLALEGQLFLRPVRYGGIGIYSFANINSQRPFYGATINLQIGKLW